MWWIWIEKSVHVLLALFYAALVLVSYFSFSRYLRFLSLPVLPNEQAVLYLRLSLKTDRILAVIGWGAVVSGSVLVVGKGYTYKTPWIVTAYFALGLLFCLLCLSYYLKQHLVQIKFLSTQWFWCVLYIFQVMLLIMVIHDAVCKLTLWGA